MPYLLPHLCYFFLVITMGKQEDGANGCIDGYVQLFWMDFAWKLA
jgi:hypothetical protein